MPVSSRIGSVFRTWLRGNRLDRDLNDELQACLDELVARKMREGRSREAARREALLELGGVEQIREEVRSGRFGHEAIVTLRDIRFASRLLARSPGFSVVATLTLALGIGANVAVFSVMHAVLWRGLPYPDADRLVLVRQHNPENEWNTSVVDFQAIAEQNTSFEAVAAMQSADVILTGGAQPRARVRGNHERRRRTPARRW